MFGMPLRVFVAIPLDRADRPSARMGAFSGAWNNLAHLLAVV